MKATTSILFGALLATTAPAQTIHIDYGRSDNTTPDNYNNLTGSGTSISNPFFELIDENGDLTGITFDHTGGSFAGSGADYAGPYPGSISSQPATAIQDSLFIRNSDGSNSAVTTLGGLDSTNTYDLTIYGARGNGGLEAIWTITHGTGESIYSISNVGNNATEEIVIEGVTPTENNEIFIDFTSEISTSSGAAMNYLRITVNEAPDTDGDLMPDYYEIANGTDPDLDDAAEDFDDDGLTNLQEFLGHDANDEVTGYGQTLSGEPDSDDDGIEDGDEVSGAMNPWVLFELAGVPGESTNPNAPDSDDDELTDGEELKDTNGSVSNPNTSDTDDDDLPDNYEVTNQLDPTDDSGDNGADGDPDGDNLLNFEEFTYFTDPQDSDSDDDTLNDEDEIFVYSSDPLSDDTDGDNLTDGDEVAGGTDPVFADTDGDEFSDSIELAAGSSPNDIDSIPSFPSISWQADEFNSVSLLSTEGTLLFAENYNGSQETINGITFVGTTSSTEQRSSSNLQTAMVNAGNIASIYDDEVPELSSLLETFWWSSGTDVSKVGITGLTPGLTYQIQIGRADDRGDSQFLGRYVFADSFGSNTGTGGVGSDNTVYGGPDNPAILLTGTFTATSTAQVFSTGQKSSDGTTSGSQISFIQVREVVPTIEIVVADLRKIGASFEVDFAGLDPTKSYQLVRSTELLDFGNVVDGPRSPGTASATFTDPAATSEKSFYRLEEQP